MRNLHFVFFVRNNKMGHPLATGIRTNGGIPCATREQVKESLPKTKTTKIAPGFKATTDIVCTPLYIVYHVKLAVISVLSTEGRNIFSKQFLCSYVHRLAVLYMYSGEGQELSLIRGLVRKLEAYCVSVCVCYWITLTGQLIDRCELCLRIANGEQNCSFPCCKWQCLIIGHQKVLVCSCSLKTK